MGTAGKGVAGVGRGEEDVDGDDLGTRSSVANLWEQQACMAMGVGDPTSIVATFGLPDWLLISPSIRHAGPVGGGRPALWTPLGGLVGVPLPPRAAIV